MAIFNFKMARRITAVMLIAALLISFIPVLLPADSALAASKSLYVNKDMNAYSPISAYAIQPAPTYLTWQQTSSPTRYGGAGLAIDTDSAILFVTFEGSGTLDIVDALNLNILGQVTAPGASNLAGIVVDQDKQKVYAVDRNTDHLYVYSWDASTHTLTNDITSPPYYVTLSGIYAPGSHGAGAHGIALDELHDLLYVTDVTTTVKIYNTANWSSAGTITASQPAMGIALDVPNGFVYTGNAYDGYGSTGLLCKYDLNTSSETATIDVNTLPGAVSGYRIDNVVGLAVDQDTGLLYATTGNQATGGSDRIIVFDSGLNMLYATGDIGNPTGIVVPGKPISYNPLNLSKTDGLGDEECVAPGASVRYTISYDNQNENDVTGVAISDTLPPEVDFVNASSGYSYDPLNRLISWNIGTVPSGTSSSVWIDVTVNASTPGGTTITNQCSIDCNETGPAFESEDMVTCTNRPPVADADGPYASTENFPIDFDAGGSSDPDGDPLEFRWDFDSDGTWDTGWSPYFIATNMWCDDFSGTATVEVTDGLMSDTDTASVEVTNLPPIIDVLSASPESVQCYKEEIEFTGIGKDPGCDDLTVEWDFGDGNVETYGGFFATFNSVVTHTYDDFGDYTVTLTVGDDDGGVDSKQIEISVRDTTPPDLIGECIESVNPHGNTIPGKERGKNGKPKPNVNPDGFYKLDFIAEDNCDPDPQIWIGTADNPMMFLIEPGIVVKFTESDDAEPEIKKIGSANGQADAVTWHIILPSDPVISAVDASGNIVSCGECLVPPPPM